MAQMAKHYFAAIIEPLNIEEEVYWALFKAQF